MYGEYTDDVILKFLAEYSFDDNQLEQYRKARRLEILAEAVAIPFIGMGFYGGLGYSFILINTALVPLEWNFSSFLLTEAQHIVAFGAIAASLVIGFGSLTVSSKINEVVKDSEISPESYSKHGLVDCFNDYQSGDYADAMEKLSELASESPPLMFEIFAVPFEEFLNRFRLLSRVSKNPVPNKQQKYINTYINQAEITDGYNNEYISDIFYDLFGLIVDDIENSGEDRDAMYQAITRTDGLDEYVEETEEKSSSPSYTDIMYDVTEGLLPEMKSIWAVYIIVLLLGVYLAQSSGVAAVVVVSVLLSAIQLYERRYR